MIDLSCWLNEFTKLLEKSFGERICFVGLQGSYARGEATNSSDIDVVVILDDLSVSDVRTYNAVLDNLPHRDKVCGFISGKTEILNWEPSDLFQFYYDTKPIKGSLDMILPLIDGDAVERAVKSGVCNIYHGCLHNMLHEKSEECLKALYKSASFVIQAICFRESGKYITKQNELLQFVSEDEKNIIETFLNIKHYGVINFDEMSERLFVWSKKRIFS